MAEGSGVDEALESRSRRDSAALASSVHASDAYQSGREDRVVAGGRIRYVYFWVFTQVDLERLARHLLGHGEVCPLQLPRTRMLTYHSDADYM